MTDYQGCPVCENGVVPAAFYGEQGDRMVTCRTCGGSQRVPITEGVQSSTEPDPRDLTYRG